MTIAPYLESVAQFEHRIDEALEAARITPVPTPDAAAVARQLADGLPLLMGDAGPDLEYVGPLARSIAAQFERDLPGPALVRLVTWRILQRALARAIAELAPVREAWQRDDCPTCGSVTALAMLLDANGARRRFLVCACCLTSWGVKRFGCPYCGNESPQSLSILQVQSPGQADESCRLDVCEECKAYVKTFTGTFPEDWPTLHLDIIAHERGYQRRGASLYDL